MRMERKGVHVKRGRKGRAASFVFCCVAGRVCRRFACEPSRLEALIPGLTFLYHVTIHIWGHVCLPCLLAVANGI